MVTLPAFRLPPAEAVTSGRDRASAIDTPTAKPPALTPSVSATAEAVAVAVTATAPVALNVPFLISATTSGLTSTIEKLAVPAPMPPAMPTVSASAFTVEFADTDTDPTGVSEPIFAPAPISARVSDTPSVLLPTLTYVNDAPAATAPSVA